MFLSENISLLSNNICKPTNSRITGTENTGSPNRFLEMMTSKVSLTSVWFLVPCIYLLGTVLCCALSVTRARLFVTPWAEASQAPLSLGILQERILQWVTMPSSSGSSQARDRTQVSHIAGGFYTDCATREAHWEQNTI